MSDQQPVSGRLEVFDTPDALASSVADWFTDLARAAPGRFIVSLSGGSTPKRLYERLATPAVRDRFPWDKVIWTFGDERFVPPDDPASNYRMVRQALFDHVPVPPALIHPFQTTGTTPEASAEAYERVLRGLAGAGNGPVFDLTFLGLGDDGHTASLIPGEPVTRERTKWVAPVPHGRENIRLSLTFPLLDRSRRAAFLVTGGGKRAILDRILSGDRDLPAGQVKPDGELIWFADREAAGRWVR